MSRLPRVGGAAVVAALRRAGFEVIRVTGSHHHLRKPGRPGVVTVAVHAGEDLPPRTMHSILRQAGLSSDDLARLL